MCKHPYLLFMKANNLKYFFNSMETFKQQFHSHIKGSLSLIFQSVAT